MQEVKIQVTKEIQATEEEDERAKTSTTRPTPTDDLFMPSEMEAIKIVTEPVTPPAVEPTRKVEEIISLSSSAQIEDKVVKVTEVATTNTPELLTTIADRPTETDPPTPDLTTTEAESTTTAEVVELKTTTEIIIETQPTTEAITSTATTTTVIVPVTTATIEPVTTSNVPSTSTVFVPLSKTEAIILAYVKVESKKPSTVSLSSSSPLSSLSRTSQKPTTRSPDPSTHQSNSILKKGKLLFYNFQNQ
jgi:hypothetical protein